MWSVSNQRRRCILNGTCWYYWPENVPILENIQKNLKNLYSFFLICSKCFNDFLTVLIYDFKLSDFLYVQDTSVTVKNLGGNHCFMVSE